MVVIQLTLFLLPLSYCCTHFVCTYCSVPTAFPESFRGVGDRHSPSCKDRALTGLVLAALQSPCDCTLPSTCDWCQIFVFWGACRACGNLPPVASSGWFSRGGHALSGMLIPGLPAHFYIIFCSTHRSAATQRDCDLFKTCWRCKLLTSKWKSIFYDCSLWDFMAGETICLLLQCLTEATAIISEGSAIFPRSQNSYREVFSVAPWT